MGSVQIGPRHFDVGDHSDFEIHGWVTAGETVVTEGVANIRPWASWQVAAHEEDLRRFWSFRQRLIRALPASARRRLRRWTVALPTSHHGLISQNVISDGNLRLGSVGGVLVSGNVLMNEAAAA